MFLLFGSTYKNSQIVTGRSKLLRSRETAVILLASHKRNCQFFSLFETALQYLISAYFLHGGIYTGIRAVGFTD